MFNNWIFLLWNQWNKSEIHEIKHCEMSVISRCPIKFILFINPFFENGWVDWKRIEFEGLGGRKRNMKSWMEWKLFNGAAAEERTMKFISSFLLWWVMGAAAPMAPPKRENKEEMNEWVSDDQKERECSSSLRQSINLLWNESWLMERREEEQTAHQGRIARGKAKATNKATHQLRLELEGQQLVELRWLTALELCFAANWRMKLVGYEPEAPLPRRNAAPSTQLIPLHSSCPIN